MVPPKSKRADSSKPGSRTQSETRAESTDRASSSSRAGSRVSRRDLLEAGPCAGVPGLVTEMGPPLTVEVDVHAAPQIADLEETIRLENDVAIAPTVEPEIVPGEVPDTVDSEVGDAMIDQEPAGGARALSPVMPAADNTLVPDDDEARQERRQPLIAALAPPA